MSHFFDQKGRHVPVRSNSHLQDTPTRSVRIGPAENLGVDDAHRITKVLAAVVVMATRVCQRTQREKRPDVGMRERECEGEAKKRIAISRAPRTKASFHSTTDNTAPLTDRCRATPGGSSSTRSTAGWSPVPNPPRTPRRAPTGTMSRSSSE